MSDIDMSSPLNSSSSSSFFFHLASPYGEGGIALYELYGEAAHDALARVFQPRGGALPRPGCARLGALVSADGQLIDEAVLTRIPASGSWCGMSCWSLSVHGGPWIQDRTAETLAALGGTPADLRQVLGHGIDCGALDAIRAAAYEHLPQALSQTVARFLLRQYQGELSAAVKDLAELSVTGDAPREFASARNLIANGSLGVWLVDPPRVLIAGRPNAGKSTLFNRLAAAERMIVSAAPGTTRDTIEETILVRDLPVRIFDSAGLRDESAAQPIERIGMDRVRRGQWDGVVYLVPFPWELAGPDRAFLNTVPADEVVVAASLGDLAPAGHSPPSFAELAVSGADGTGVDQLCAAMARRWLRADLLSSTGEVPCAPFLRCQVDALVEFLESAGSERASLDDARSRLIEYLLHSWPPDR